MAAKCSAAVIELFDIIHLTIQNMVIPEYGNTTPIIYKKQEELRKFGEVHKKQLEKYAEF